MKQITTKIPGMVLSAAIAFPAWLLGKIFPVIGSPVIGMLFGMLLAFWKRPTFFQEGIQYTSKKLLQYSIILLGFGMNLYQVFTVGRQTLVLMAFTLTAAFLAAYLTGKALRLDRNTKVLIGVGSAICGGSAIAAVAPVIRAEDEEVARSISTIFLFNVIAAFLFPALGHALGLSDYHFGLWAGTAVNDTSSVVAAGYSFSNAAGDLAVIVKLTRTLMIVPVTLVLAIFTSRRDAAGQSGTFQLGRVFPWFVLWFICAALMNTLLPLPAGVGHTLSQAGKFVIVMAMAAIGLNTHLPRLVKNGARPILLGLTCWCVIAVTSLAVQFTLLKTLA